MKRLAKFVGSQFLDDLGVFFTEFNDVLGGFRQRAEETFALLRQPRVGFVLVASPEAMAVREALFFHERLVTAAMPFVGFVVNKVHPSRPSAHTRRATRLLEAARSRRSAATRSGARRRPICTAARSDVLADADEIGAPPQAGRPDKRSPWCVRTRTSTTCALGVLGRHVWPDVAWRC
jgi:anion-transporting  ArsA/GET3 family ATPase